MADDSRYPNDDQEQIGHSTDEDATGSADKDFEDLDEGDNDEDEDSSAVGSE